MKLLGMIGLISLAIAGSARAAIDREKLVSRHDPMLSAIDYSSPLTVGNGEFAFTADVTGLQTFQDDYYQRGIPLETLGRWCWTTEPNPQGYKLSDANQPYLTADGKTVELPTLLGSPASDWLRRNPRLHPLGEIALDWTKADGSPFVPADVHGIRQQLDLWRGVLTSRYQLGGEDVTVETACDPDTDTIAVRIVSKLVGEGKLRARVAFPRGHDPAVKNTPPLDWSHPGEHTSKLASPTTVERSIGDTRYFFGCSRPLRADGPHRFLIGPPAGDTLAFSVRFSPQPAAGAVTAPEEVIRRSAARWPNFWQRAAAADFAGSGNPLAAKLEERIILSQYLEAVQCVADFPPQESGLTCNTWYGKHHTEMTWWHVAHFILGGRSDLAERNLAWFVSHLPAARALAQSRGLRGARWAKMVGPEDRESPGGNAVIVWNQPHLVYLAELLYRNSPTPATLAKYGALVQDTAEGLASMLVFDAKRGQYVLGPPLWIAEEIHDPATSQNPSFELAYWRWALGIAQQWRERRGQPRDAKWDEMIAQLAPLPVAQEKYVALESTPDTWTTKDSRHDHPEMLMPLGFLPGGPEVDRATMNRTLDGVLRDWDWETKIFGWDYPMVAMTATRLGRPADAVEILLRDGPNNRYTRAGHCPQSSDRTQASNAEGRREIAVYLPANGAFLSAVALMLAGWDGCTEKYPGIPKDGSWKVAAEGWRPLP